MELSYELIKGTPQVSVLNVAGRVDGSNYSKLIEQAKELFESGAFRLLLNLEGCDFLSSAGLFALHSIALMAHKIKPLDPESGWESLKAAVDDDRDYKENFKIVNAQPNVLRTLNISGFSKKFDIYTDMQEALSAFKSTE